MRKVKRFIKAYTAEKKLKPRIKELETQLQNDLNLKTKPRLIRAGYRGHDSNYLVKETSKTIGVIRVLNPYKNHNFPNKNMPFQVVPSESRLNYEFDIYKRGSMHDLTPKPLWHTKDAHMCSYVKGHSLFDIMAQNWTEFWHLAKTTTLAIARLHAAGITHMDMSVYNILVTGNSSDPSTYRFIDFEYSSVSNLSLDQQKAYDHLRVLESIWKFVPEKIIYSNDAQNWLNTFNEYYKPCELTLLKPGLDRVLKHPMFNNL